MKITLAGGFVSNSFESGLIPNEIVKILWITQETDLRQIGSFLSQIPEIDRDRSENIIHQASC